MFRDLKKNILSFKNENKRHITETYLTPYRTSTMEVFVKIVDG